MRIRDKIVYEVDDEDELNEIVDDYDDERIEDEMEEFMCERSVSFYIQLRGYLEESGIYVGEYINMDKVYKFAWDVLEHQIEKDNNQ